MWGGGVGGGERYSIHSHGKGICLFLINISRKMLLVNVLFCFVLFCNLCGLSFKLSLASSG